MVVGVKMAYFDVPATRPIFNHIPAEDRMPLNAGEVARLNLSVYGMRNSAQN